MSEVRHSGWYQLGKRARKYCSDHRASCEVGGDRILIFNFHTSVVLIKCVLYQDKHSVRNWKGKQNHPEVHLIWLGLPTGKMTFSYAADMKSTLHNCPSVPGGLPCSLLMAAKIDIMKTSVACRNPSDLSKGGAMAQSLLGSSNLSIYFLQIICWATSNQGDSDGLGRHGSSPSCYGHRARGHHFG